MDTETTEAIGRLGTRIDTLGADLRAEMRELRKELRGEIQMCERRLRTEFRAGLEDNRRHAQVMFETLRDDIRLLADGFAALNEKIDRLPRLDRE